MHTFAVSGLMSLQVTVTDAANDTSNSAPFTVTVADPIATPLTLTPPAPQTAIPGQSQSFDLGSFTDANSTMATPVPAPAGPFTVTVDWGDGSADDSVAVNFSAHHPPPPRARARARVRCCARPSARARFSAYLRSKRKRNP